VRLLEEEVEEEEEIPHNLIGRSVVVVRVEPLVPHIEEKK
jgi:hypothetical protein